MFMRIVLCVVVCCVYNCMIERLANYVASLNDLLFI